MFFLHAIFLTFSWFSISVCLYYNYGLTCLLAFSYANSSSIVLFSDKFLNYPTNEHFYNKHILLFCTVTRIYYFIVVGIQSLASFTFIFSCFKTIFLNIYNLRFRFATLYSNEKKCTILILMKYRVTQLKVQFSFHSYWCSVAKRKLLLLGICWLEYIIVFMNHHSD